MTLEAFVISLLQHALSASTSTCGVTSGALILKSLWYNSKLHVNPWHTLCLCTESYRKLITKNNITIAFGSTSIAMSFDFIDKLIASECFKLTYYIYYQQLNNILATFSLTWYTLYRVCLSWKLPTKPASFITVEKLFVLCNSANLQQGLSTIELSEK